MPVRRRRESEGRDRELGERFLLTNMEVQLGIDAEPITRSGFRAGGGELHDFHCATDQPSVARALQTRHEDACRDARVASFRAAARMYQGADPSLHPAIPVPPMQWLGRTDGEAELRQAPPAGDGLSEAIRHLLRTKPGTIAVGNAGGGECGPLSLGYDGTRDRPGRSQTGERRADLVRFARENPGLLLLEFPAKTTISLSQVVARSFRGYAHQYEAEPTFETWCSAMACPGFKYDDSTRRRS